MRRIERSREHGSITVSDAPLRRPELTFKAFLDASPDMISILGPDSRIRFVSAAVREILGYGPEERIGQHPLDFTHPDDRERIARLLQDVFEDGGASGSRLRYRHRDGRWVTLEFRCRPVVGREERVTSVIVISRDVTEWVRLEEELDRAMVAAEHADVAKSAFLARMSHELRTPLNAILGFAQLLEMDTQTHEQEDSTRQILKAGRHLLDLINEVLDISRIESGRFSISCEPAPVAEVVRESLDLTGPMATKRNVRLINDAAEKSDRHVLADRQRLTQVMLNLLTNAIKYNREGGTVTLSLEDVPERRLRIKVADTGAGIPSEAIHRLFTPFERLGAELAGVEGVGIGLALSKKLVEVMGGQIGVDSSVGQGSTFWVELPLVEGQIEKYERRQEEEVQPPLQPREFEKARTLLYIEDNLSNLELMRRLLAPRVRIKLLTAMQGRLGLDLAREHYPDLILLDLHLPDMSGDEVLRRLLDVPETRDTPVVMISAEASPGEIRRLLDAGARAYLTKPFEVRRLLALLDETLSEQPSEP